RLRESASVLERCPVLASARAAFHQSHRRARSCVRPTPRAGAAAVCHARHESGAGCRTPPASLLVCSANDAAHDQVRRYRSERRPRRTPAGTRCCGIPLSATASTGPCGCTRSPSSSLLLAQATSAMCSPAWGRVSRIVAVSPASSVRSEEHTSELQSPYDLVCRLLLEKKKK